MTPADEALFIQLWQQELPTAAIVIPDVAMFEDTRL